MLVLEKALAAWDGGEFDAVFKRELAQYAEELPLQRALARGSVVADRPLTILVQRAEDAGDALQVKAGVFYESLIGGCACTDDPTPESTYTEYCEIEVAIDKLGGAATIRLLEE